jgi:ABC-type lipoprotein release transport system permease subunit
MDRPVRSEVFIAAAQHPKTGLSLKIVARTSVEPLVLADSLRQRARDLDPEVPVVLTTADRMVAQTLSAPRFRSLLLALFAGAALLLAVVGVAGVMACSVAERRREIGVRLAIGATSASILRRFLGRSVRLAALGLALGLVGSTLAARVLEGLLFGIAPSDPRTLIVVSALLLLATIAAAAWPALSAARQSPMTALQSE